MKKVEKRNNPNQKKLFWCKANIKHFCFNNLYKDFDMIIFHIAMDFCQDNFRIQTHIYFHSVHLEKQIPNTFLNDI